MASPGTGCVHILQPGCFMSHLCPLPARPSDPQGGGWGIHLQKSASLQTGNRLTRCYCRVKLERGFKNMAIVKQNTLSSKPWMNFYKQWHLRGRDLSVGADRCEVLCGHACIPGGLHWLHWGVRPYYLLKCGPWASSLAFLGGSLKMQYPAWTC